MAENDPSESKITNMNPVMEPIFTVMEPISIQSQNFTRNAKNINGPKSILKDVIFFTLGTFSPTGKCCVGNLNFGEISM